MNTSTKGGLGYPMISDEMHAYLFGGEREAEKVSGITRARTQASLQRFGTNLPEYVELNQKIPELPPLMGQNIIEHLDSIAETKWGRYKPKILKFLQDGIPPVPSDYVVQPGWTRYSGNEVTKVPHPTESTLVIDVETFVQFGGYPVMAAAVSNDAWYLWLHPAMASSKKMTPLLIPIGTHKLILNHNPLFDAARFQESFTLHQTNLYLDTESMHIAVAGMSNKQTKAFAAQKNYSAEWAKHTAKNSLVDVYNFHVQPLLPLTKADKTTRNIFVNASSIDQIKAQMEEVVNYNFHDVKYTYELGQALVPKFFKRAPSTITLAGQLIMSKSILPVSDEWDEWRITTDAEYGKRKAEIRRDITNWARLIVNRFVKGELKTQNSNPWYAQLDWTPAKSGKNVGEPLWWRKVKSKGIGPTSHLTPLLLNISWDGYPLIYDKKLKWIFECPPDYIGAFKQDDKFYAKVPHPKGDKNNCGDPLGKDYIQYIQEDGNGKLSTPKKYARALLLKARSIAYWTSIRKRVFTYQKTQLSDANGYAVKPQVSVNGTGSGRAVERLWLTVSGPKKDMIGSECKSMVKAPRGKVFVAADFDSQESKLSAGFADAYLQQIFGATSMSNTIMVGDKSKGTDTHTLLAKYLKINRSIAKNMNFQMLYLAGVTGCATTIKTNRPDLSIQECTDMATSALALRRGKKKFIKKGVYKYEGGTDSECYNFLLALADHNNLPHHLRHLNTTDLPRTPALKRAMSQAILHRYCGGSYLTSRANWGVQGSGVDILHLFIVSLDYLFDYYQVKGDWIWSVHDENWTCVDEADAPMAVWCMQVAHLWCWSYFFKSLGFNDLPYSYQWFSEVNIDTRLRKEVDLDINTTTYQTDEPNGLGVHIDKLYDLFTPEHLERLKLHQDGVSK